MWTHGTDPEASKRRQHQEFDFVSGGYASDTVIHSYSVTPKLVPALPAVRCTTGPWALT